MDEILTIDELSGNPIRKTDNDLRDDDIISPQGKEPLPLGDGGLPIWWDRVKGERGDIHGDR